MKDIKVVIEKLSVQGINLDIEQMLLLEKFIEIWQVINPDIVTGWNCKFYDIPYLVRRISYLMGEKAVKRLSPWDVVNEGTILTWVDNM